MFTAIFRLFKFALQNFFRNFWLSFVTITIFVLTLLTVNAVIFLNLMANATLESIEDKVEIAVYFTTDASEDIAKAAQGYLLGLPQVRNATYISAEDAIIDFRERHKDDPIILSSIDEVGGNPLGHAVIVSAHSPEDFPFILEAIETPEFSPYVRNKDYENYEDIILNIQSVNERIKIGGIIVAGFFGLIAIMIIFNTIRVAIYVHRDEIGIMKLVGANDWFIRGPFLLEAFFYSLIATAIIIGIVFLFLTTFETRIANFFGEVDISVFSYFFDNGLLIFGSQFAVLTVLSLLTTWFAMRNYLKV